MTKLVLVQALMPVAKMLLEKLFDLFKGSADSYNSSAKTSEDLDKFVKEAKQDMGQFEKLAKEIDPNFKMSGDADSSSDFRKIVTFLEELRTQTTDKSQISSIDSMVKAFGDAANQMDAPSYKGDKGDADLTIQSSSSLIPKAGGSLYSGFFSTGSSTSA
jgi:hypothetical protein